MCLGEWEWEVQLEACFDLLHVLYMRKEGGWEGNALQGGNHKSK